MTISIFVSDFHFFLGTLKNRRQKITHFFLNGYLLNVLSKNEIIV